MTILLEQIQEQNRATIEAVFSMETTLRREMAEIGLSLDQKISSLETAVRLNAEAIGRLSDRVDGLSDRVESLDQRMNRLEGEQQHLREKVSAIHALITREQDRAKAASDRESEELKALEARVVRLEKHLGI